MDTCKQHDFCFECLLQWLLSKNTCPSCNLKVNAIWLPKGPDTLLIAEPGKTFHEVSEPEPESAKLGGAPSQSVHDKLNLFDRTETSIYQERCHISIKPDRNFNFTVKNGTFETIAFQIEKQGSKYEVSLTFRTQGQPETTILKQKTNDQASQVIIK